MAPRMLVDLQPRELVQTIRQAFVTAGGAVGNMSTGEFVAVGIATGGAVGVTSAGGIVAMRTPTGDAGSVVR